MTNRNSARLNAERAKYDGMTQREVVGQLIAVNESIFGGEVGEGIIDLYKAIRKDRGVLTYLAETYAQINGTTVNTSELDIKSLQMRVLRSLLRSGQLPEEVHRDAGKYNRNNLGYDFGSEAAYVGS